MFAPQLVLCGDPQQRKSFQSDEKQKFLMLVFQSVPSLAPMKRGRKSWMRLFLNDFSSGRSLRIMHKLGHAWSTTGHRKSSS